MTYLFWFFAIAVWFSFWVWLIASQAARRDGDELISRLGVLLPAFCATTCLGCFLVIPERSALFYKITLWVHHSAVLMLFLFLAVAEYLQVEGWLRILRGCSTETVTASYRRLWAWSEIVPAPVALVIFLTGLRLIWDWPQTNTPSSMWLLALIVGFSFFFWDGLLGYRPVARRMWLHWKRVAESKCSVAEAGGPEHFLTDSLQLLLHFLSWPFVFLFGMLRWPTETPLTKPLSNGMVTLSFLPEGWPEVVSAVILWVGTGLVVVAVRSGLSSLRKSSVSAT